MNAQEKFHDRLAQIVDAHTERGEWFALWPVRTSAGWVWLKKVNYVRSLSLTGDKLGFVTRYDS
jgi:hypothetical protein